MSASKSFYSRIYYNLEYVRQSIESAVKGEDGFTYSEKDKSKNIKDLERIEEDIRIWNTLKDVIK